MLAVVLVARLGIDDLDEGYFAQQATRVLHGQLPYRDFESLYTPGLTYLHAALFALVGGPDLVAMRVLGLVWRAALALLLWLVARRVVRSPLWAALPSVYLLVAWDAAPDRWEPHPGWPSALCAVLAAWCLLRPANAVWLLAAGAAAAASYVFKQNAGVYLLAAIGLRALIVQSSTLQHRPLPGRLGNALAPWHSGSVWRSRELLLPLLAFATTTVLWLGPLVVALDGQVALLGPFVGAVNQAGLASAPEITNLLPVLALLAGCVLVARGRASAAFTWCLIAGAALFLTQYPRADTLHLAWSAPLLLVVGAALLERAPRLPAAAALAMLAVLAWPVVERRIEVVRQPTTVVTGLPPANSLRVPAPTWADLLNVSAEIQFRTAPGEPIFVYPTSPLLYVLADRPNATRFDHLNPGAATPAQIDQVIADLAPVNVAVVGDFWRGTWDDAGDNAPLEAVLATDFRTVARHGQYRVLVRL